MVLALFIYLFILDLTRKWPVGTGLIFIKIFWGFL